MFVAPVLALLRLAHHLGNRSKQAWLTPPPTPFHACAPVVAVCVSLLVWSGLVGLGVWVSIVYPTYITGGSFIAMIAGSFILFHLARIPVGAVCALVCPWEPIS